MAYKDQGGGGGYNPAEATLRVEISDLGTVLVVFVDPCPLLLPKVYWNRLDLFFVLIFISKHNKEDGYDNGSTEGSHGSSGGYGLRVPNSESDDDDEYSFGSLSILPKGRPAALRDRISSVNSEVTIHDVRRCTITGPSSIYCHKKLTILRPIRKPLDSRKLSGVILFIFWFVIDRHYGLNRSISTHHSFEPDQGKYNACYMQHLTLVPHQCSTRPF